MKICKDCLQPFPLKKPWQKHSSYCKPCAAIRSKMNYAENRPVRREQQKWYRDARKENLNSRSRRYYAQNQQKLLIQKKEYYKSHHDQIVLRRLVYYGTYREQILAREKIRYQVSLKKSRQTTDGRKRSSQYAQRWQRKYPEKVNELSARRRAQKRNAAVVEKIDRRYIYNRDGGKCHICHRKVEFSKMTLDHLIPLSKGGNHTHDNLALAHRSCNSRRGAGRLPAQLLLIG